MDIYFEIDNLKIKRVDKTPMTADSDNLVRCHFAFTGDMWEQAEKKYAIFAHDGKSYVINLTAENDEYCCKLPDYCNVAPEYTVGVSGFYFDDDLPVKFYTNICPVRPTGSCKPQDISANGVPVQFDTIMGIIADIYKQIKEAGASVDPEAVTEAVNAVIEALNLDGTYAPLNHDHDTEYAPINHSHSGYITDVSGKADKVQNATNGNLAGLDGNGNLVDSGNKVSDFAGANHNHDTTYAPLPEAGIVYQQVIRAVNVAVQGWLHDNTFEQYPYRASIAIQGATLSDYANVFFSAQDAESNMFAPYTDTGENTVYIYATDIPEGITTLPLIEVVKVV